MFDFTKPPVKAKAALLNIPSGGATNYLDKTFKAVLLPGGMFLNDHLIACLLGIEETKYIAEMFNLRSSFKWRPKILLNSKLAVYISSLECRSVLCHFYLRGSDMCSQRSGTRAERASVRPSVGNISGSIYGCQ